MKKMLRITFAVIVMCTSFSVVNAQGLAPQWKNGYFEELDNSYIEVVSGSGRTIDEARSKAVNDVVSRRNLASGASLNVKVTDGQISTDANGRLTVKSRIIDEYVEENYGEYRVWLLTQTAKNPSYSFESVTITDSYPFSARCLVPGMQQLYKGQTVKGISFIGAEVLTVGGIIVSESMRADYSNKASVERNATRKTNLIDNANTMQNVRNICIGAAAAVYVWNVVDAIVSKGGKRVVLADASLVPYASPDGFGLAFNYRF